MNKTLILILCIAMQGLITNETSASDVYNIQLRAAVVTIDQDDIDTSSGLGLGFKLPLTENWYIDAKHLSVDVTTDMNIDADYTNWYLGVGHSWSVSETASVYLQLSAETQRLKAGPVSLDERGASIELGSHIELNTAWDAEFYGRFSDINITESEPRSSEFYFGARVSYTIIDNLSIALSYETGEFEQAMLGVNFNF